MTATLTEAQVTEALRPVQDPELHRSIVDLGMVRRVDIDRDRVHVVVDLTIAGCPLRAEIDRRVKDAVTMLDGAGEVTVEYGVMTDEQRAALRQQLHGDPGATAGSQQAHGHAEGREISFAKPEPVSEAVGCEVGCVPPFGHLTDLPIYADPDLTRQAYLYFNPGVHHKSIKIKSRDLKKLCKPG